jgi:hypothetical protein
MKRSLIVLDVVAPAGLTDLPSASWSHSRHHYCPLLFSLLRDRTLYLRNHAAATRVTPHIATWNTHMTLSAARVIVSVTQ